MHHSRFRTRLAASAVIAVLTPVAAAAAQTQSATYYARERLAGLAGAPAAQPEPEPTRNCPIAAYKTVAKDFPLTQLPGTYTSLAAAKAACNSIPGATACKWTNTSTKRIDYTKDPAVTLTSAGVDLWAAVCT